jgi:hypothetical protein
MLLVDSKGGQDLGFVPCAKGTVKIFLVEADELDKWAQLFSWWPPGHPNTALFVAKGHHQVVLRALLRALKRSSLSLSRERTRSRALSLSLAYTQ